MSLKGDGAFIPWNAQAGAALPPSSGCKHTTEILCVWERSCSQMETYSQIQGEFYPELGLSMVYSIHILEMANEWNMAIMCQTISAQCHSRSVAALKTQVLSFFIRHFPFMTGFRPGCSTNLPGKLWFQCLILQLLSSYKTPLVPGVPIIHITSPNKFLSKHHWKL